MSTTNLSLVILAVTDLPRSIKFYSHIFEWEIAAEEPTYIEYRLPDGMRLALYERHAFGKNPGQTPILIPRGTLAPTELYFIADDFTTLEHRLFEAEAEMLSPMEPRSWGDLVAYYADPDGNVLAIMQPRPET